MNQLRKSNTKIFHSLLCKRDLPMVTETSLSLYLFNVVSTNHINAWNVEMSLKIRSFPQFKKPHVRPSLSSFLPPLLSFSVLGWRGSDTGSYKLNKHSNSKQHPHWWILSYTSRPYGSCHLKDMLFPNRLEACLCYDPSTPTMVTDSCGGIRKIY